MYWPWCGVFPDLGLDASLILFTFSDDNLGCFEFCPELSLGYLCLRFFLKRCFSGCFSQFKLLSGVVDISLTPHFHQHSELAAFSYLLAFLAMTNEVGHLLR